MIIILKGLPTAAPSPPLLNDYHYCWWNSLFSGSPLAHSLRLHFSNTGLRWVLGSSPNFCPCFSVVDNSPTQLLICLDRALFVPVVCSIKKRRFEDWPNRASAICASQQHFAIALFFRRCIIEVWISAIAIKCPRCASTHIRKNKKKYGKRSSHMCWLWSSVYRFLRTAGLPRRNKKRVCAKCMWIV